MLNRFRLPLALALVATLTACATSNTTKVGSLPMGQGNLDKTLALADKKKGTQAASLYLAAADMAWKQGDTLKARSLLESVDLLQLAPAQQIFGHTLAAEMAMKRGQSNTALKYMSQPVFAHLGELPIQQQIRSHNVKARAQEARGRILPAVRERIYLGGMLDTRLARENNELIWALVNKLPANTAPKADEQELAGWLELARIASGSQGIDGKQQQLQQWFANHPHHPATLLQPEALHTLLSVQARPLQRIALALPSLDRNQTVVNAMRNGFLSQYYQAQQQGQPVPELRFYDSSMTSLEQMYQQARQENLDMLVGPWEKDLVRQLVSQQGLPVPTLALNYSEQPGSTANLYQFGLSPEDEARYVTQRAWEEGKRSAVIIVPESEWGQRVHSAFANAWQQQGGKLADSILIGQESTLAPRIANVFGLRESEARGKQMAELLDGKVNTNPARRPDIDVIFLAAPPQQARLIKPLLTLQYADDLPVYATSSVNPINANPALLYDLEGIRFADLPWLFNTSNLHTEINQRWPEASGPLGRIYAMGADAYLLATQLQLMNEVPGSSTPGLTGQLKLDPQNRVQRTPVWVEFRDGKLEQLP